MFYPLTSKLDTPAQLAKHERRRHVLRRVAEAGGASSSGTQTRADTPPSSLSSDKHHYITSTRNNPVNIFAFLREHDGNPAIKVGVIGHLGHVVLKNPSEFHTETKGSYSV